MSELSKPMIFLIVVILNVIFMTVGLYYFFNGKSAVSILGMILSLASVIGLLIALAGKR